MLYFFYQSSIFSPLFRRHWTFFLFLVAFGQASAQSLGDYRSNGNVTFASATNWQSFDGGSWVNAASSPTFADGVITIDNGHVATVDANTTLDEVVIASGGTLQINASIVCTLSDGLGTDMAVQSGGTINIQNGGSLTGAGLFSVLSGAFFKTAHASGFNAIGAGISKNFVDGVNYEFNGTVAQTLNNPVGLTTNNIVLNNSAGAILSNDITIAGSLTLTNGSFNISGRSVTFHTANLPIVRTSGRLATNASTNLFFGTAGFTSGTSFDIPSSLFISTPSVGNITINRDNPLRWVNQDLVIVGTLDLVLGVLDMSNRTFTFHTSNTPISRTSGTITTNNNSSLNFGATGNTGGNAFTLPESLFTSNPTFSSITINRVNAITWNSQHLVLRGTLTLTSGVFNVGNIDLTFHTSNTPISRSTGTLTLGTNCNLAFGITGSTGGNLFAIPNNVFTTAPVFNNFTINRTSALSWNNQILTLSGQLNLILGTFNVNFTSTLIFHSSNIPIARTSGTMNVSRFTNLTFGTVGNTTGNSFTLPNALFTSSPSLNNLTINRDNALIWNAQPLILEGTLTLTKGEFDIASNLTFQIGNTPIARTDGTLKLGFNSNLTFGTVGNTNGASFTIPNDVFSVAPTLTYFSICRFNSLTWNNQNLTVNDTFTQSSLGSFVTPTGVVVYGASASLLYNNSTDFNYSCTINGELPLLNPPLHITTNLTGSGTATIIYPNLSRNIAGALTIGAGDTFVFSNASGSFTASTIINNGTVNNCLNASITPAYTDAAWSPKGSYNVFVPITEPTVEATNLSFSIVSTSAYISWVNGNGAYRIVVVKPSAPIDVNALTDNTVYNANASFGAGSLVDGTGRVVYQGTGSGVNITNLSNGVTYHVAVFEYSGLTACNPTVRDYKIGSPLSGNFTTNNLDFVTTWRTTDGTITIPVSGVGHNYNISWVNMTNANIGNGFASNQTGSYTITGLNNNDTYQISISGVFPNIYINNGTEKTKLYTIKQWGNMAWNSMANAFHGCSNLSYAATDVPNLASVTDMSYMFSGCANISFVDFNAWNTSTVNNMKALFQNCTNLNSLVTNWNTSNVTDMSYMFQGCANFNVPLNWTTNNVTNMAYMFNGAGQFNQNISTWNTSNVTDMSYMFRSAGNFNQNIGGWNTSNVTNMAYMFYSAVSFNQNIGTWNTGNVTNMSYMFRQAQAFNQPIGTWNTSNVTNMEAMFQITNNFNQNIGTWNTGNVTNMSYMFDQAAVFNRPIGAWNTVNVTNMTYMFHGALVFNQSIGAWNTGNVTNMAYMFRVANAFNQNINTWNVGNVTDMSFMFNFCPVFNQPLNNWDVSKVTNMRCMFQTSVFNQPLNSWNTSSLVNMEGTFRQNNFFNQPLNNWNTSNVTDMSGAFADGVFNQDLSSWDFEAVTNIGSFFSINAVSSTNYDNLLISLASQNVQPNLFFGVTGRQYCAGWAARTFLINTKGWFISGDSPVSTCTEINLQANAQNIASGDTTPSSTDNTDFGITSISGKTLTYTIQNLGPANLTLSGTPRVQIIGSTDFTVVSQPSSNTIASNSSLTFQIQFLPTGANGLKTATVSIANNDTDENPYTFAIRGYKVYATPDTKRGNMLSLDGVNDYLDFVTPSFNTSIFAYQNAFSVETWIKTNANTGTHHIVGMLNNAAIGWAFRINNSKLEVLMAQNYPFNYMTVTGNTSVANNEWHHVAFSNDGAGNFNLYVDGELQINTIFIDGSVAFTNPQPFYVGRHPSFGQYWQGELEEMRLWSNARTQAQIRENMHLTLQGNETNLQLYFQFNETMGDAIDVINGFNGALTNGASRTESTVSVAKGFATRLTAPAGASTQVFGNATINFTAMSAPAMNDEFVAYQMQDTPLNNLTATNTASNYWIVRQFGTQTFSYDQMSFTLPANHVISTTDEGTPSNLKLFKRNTNSASAWGTEIGTGTSANNTTKIINYTLSPAQTSFSEFAIASTTSPLPITLLGLKGYRVTGNGISGGQGNGFTEQVRLEWATASEINNKGFEVEMSQDGLAYEKIAFVEGKGNSLTSNIYQLTTNNPSDSYYRLRQIDFDGKFSYSPIVFVEGLAGEVKVYPNPSQDYFIISTGKDKLDSARLLNAQGQEVWRGVQTEVRTTGLPSGVYFLHTTMAGKTNITKVVVER